jgi:hypothetical protein
MAWSAAFSGCLAGHFLAPPDAQRQAPGLEPFEGSHPQGLSAHHQPEALGVAVLLGGSPRQLEV